jgi:hypothetical protein
MSIPTAITTIVHFLLRQAPWFFRLWGIVVIAVGILIVWAGWPK